MKPKIGEQIWCVYQDQIIKETVEFLGKESFIIEGYEYKYDAEYEYKYYNEDWFKNLEKAKKSLLKKNSGKKVKIIKISDFIYQLVGEDEE